LIRGNPLLVLDLSLHVVDGVRRLNIQGDGLSRQCLHKDLHTSTKTKNQVKSGLLLDVVVTQGTAVLQLLTCKDQTLLIRGNPLLVLDLSLHVVDGVRRLNIQGDGLSRQCLHKDLHTSTKTKNQVKGGLLLDIVVTQGTTILQLLTGKDQTLLIRGDSFLILDLSFDVVDRVGWFDIEGDGLTRECFDENLHVNRCG